MSDPMSGGERGTVAPERSPNARLDCAYEDCGTFSCDGMDGERPCKAIHAAPETERAREALGRLYGAAIGNAGVYGNRTWSDEATNDLDTVRAALGATAQPVAWMEVSPMLTRAFFFGPTPPEPKNGHRLVPLYASLPVAPSRSGDKEGSDSEESQAERLKGPSTRPVAPSEEQRIDDLCARFVEKSTLRRMEDDAARGATGEGNEESQRGGAKP